MKLTKNSSLHARKYEFACLSNLTSLLPSPFPRLIDLLVYPRRYDRPIDPSRALKCLYRGHALRSRNSGAPCSIEPRGRNSSSHFGSKNGRNNGGNCRFEVTLHSSPFSLCPLKPTAATFAPCRPAERVETNDTRSNFSVTVAIVWPTPETRDNHREAIETARLIETLSRNRQIDSVRNEANPFRKASVLDPRWIRIVDSKRDGWSKHLHCNQFTKE